MDTESLVLTVLVIIWIVATIVTYVWWRLLINNKPTKLTHDGWLKGATEARRINPKVKCGEKDEYNN